MQTNTHETPTHDFEAHLVNEAATGTGDRLPYEMLLCQRANFLKQTCVSTSDKAANPIIFFNQQRQMIHANKAALVEIIGKDIKDAIGLRLGELFGCDHKMSQERDDVYKCQDCNNMTALRAALAGRQSVETRHLIMHPFDRPIRAVFKVSSVPISAGDEYLAMLIFEEVKDSDAI